MDFFQLLHVFLENYINNQYICAIIHMVQNPHERYLYGK